MSTRDSGRSGPDALSAQQQHIYAVICALHTRLGYPPSVREIATAVDLAPSSVHRHLRALEAAGLLKRTDNGSRKLRIDRPTPPEPPKRWRRHPMVWVPLLGNIAAGYPIEVPEDQRVEDELSLPSLLVGDGSLFALRVKGDSMIEAAICDDDIVVVRQQKVADNGDIVAAMINGEATVKVFRQRDGRVELVPCNPRYEVINGDAVTILGTVVCVIRSLSHARPSATRRPPSRRR